MECEEGNRFGAPLAIAPCRSPIGTLRSQQLHCYESAIAFAKMLTHTIDLTIDGEAVLPGFALDLAIVW